MNMHVALRRWWVLLLCVAMGCTRKTEVAAPAVQSSPSVTVGDPLPDGTLEHLEGRFGDPDALWAEASFKVKRAGGKVTKDLEIKVENAPPGVTHAVSIDGFPLGRIITRIKGEGEFSLIEAGDDFFPQGLPEPKPGSVIRIGELAELQLESLEKLMDLRADISGPGELSGKIGYKIERLGDTVTKEFRVKVTGAEVKSVHPVMLDGIHIADLTIDLSGKGKVEFSTLAGAEFPPAFREPRAGSSIEIAGIFNGELKDGLAAHAK